MKVSNLKIKEELKQNNKILNVLNPDFIVIENNFDNIIKLNDYVFKNTIVTNKNSPIYTPISGIVSKIDKYIYISNDFIELEKETKKIKRKKHDDLDVIIKELKEYGYENDEFYKKISKKNKNIIINGYDDIPYMNNKSIYLIKYKDEVLKLLELINKITNNKIILTLDSKNNELVSSYKNLEGIYPFIEIKYFTNEYPLYNEKAMCNILNIKEEETIIINACELIEIFNIITRNKPLNEVFVRINDFTTNKSRIINVKLGTSIDEIIEVLKIDIKNKIITINNILDKNIIDINEMYVKKDLYTINITDKEDAEETECIKCGNCIVVCPFKECQNCGLCRYYCPTKQNKCQGVNNE